MARSTKSKGAARTVALRCGGTVTVALSVDVLKLTPSDRDIVFQVLDMLTDYERISIPTPAVES